MLGRDWLRIIPLNWADIIQRRLGINMLCPASKEEDPSFKILVSRYPRLFENTTGKITGKVEEYDLLLRIFETINYIKWTTPVVVFKKKNNTLGRKTPI